MTSTMLTKGLRRFRKPNYTREETEILLDQLLKYGNFLFGKSQPGVNNQQRADVWASIASLVNSVPNSAGRTVEELKHRWQDLAQRARVALRKSSDDKQRQMPYLDKVLRVMGETRSDAISTPSKGNSSPSPSIDTSDPDASSSCNIEIKQENIESNQESNPPVKHKGNSLKRVLPPLKTPSFKRFKFGNDLMTNYSQNGMSSDTTFHSVEHNLPADDSFQTNLVERKPYSTFSNRRGSRPMVMDPDSQFITEVDVNEDEDRSNSSSGTNNDDGTGNKCGSSSISSVHCLSTVKKSMAHVNVNGSDVTSHCTECFNNGHMQDERGKPSRTFGTIYNIHSQVGVEEPHDALETQFLETLNKQQLERQCLISTIRLQNQQRSYVKLKEEKLHLELELLRNKTSHLASKNIEITPMYTRHDCPSSDFHHPDNTEDCHHDSSGYALKSPSGTLDFEVANESGKHLSNDKIEEESDNNSSKSMSNTCVQEDGSKGHQDQESNGVQGEKEEESQPENHVDLDSKSPPDSDDEETH